MYSQFMIKLFSPYTIYFYCCTSWIYFLKVGNPVRLLWNSYQRNKMKRRNSQYSPQWNLQEIYFGITKISETTLLYRKTKTIICFRYILSDSKYIKGTRVVHAYFFNISMVVFSDWNANTVLHNTLHENHDVSLVEIMSRGDK